MEISCEDVVGGVDAYYAALRGSPVGEVGSATNTEFLCFSMRRFNRNLNLSGWRGDNRGFSKRMTYNDSDGPQPSSRIGLEFAVPMEHTAASLGPSCSNGTRAIKAYSWSSGTHVIEDAGQNSCVGRALAGAVRETCRAIKCFPLLGDARIGESGFDVCRSSHSISARRLTRHVVPPTQQGGSAERAVQPLTTPQASGHTLHGAAFDGLQVDLTFEGAISHLQPFAPSLATHATLVIRSEASGEFHVRGTVWGTSFPDMELLMRYRGWTLTLARYQTQLSSRGGLPGVWLLTNRCHALAEFDLSLNDVEVDASRPTKHEWVSRYSMTLSTASKHGECETARCSTWLPAACCCCDRSARCCIAQPCGDMCVFEGELSQATRSVIAWRTAPCTEEQASALDADWIPVYE
mmetsp:Transcript_54399/g.151555  ORF Transcript_54399/g.151555 Transcript_54399/m.151555 type:complete len:407 (-) Transcript_54399:9-1229(-)